MAKKRRFTAEAVIVWRVWDSIDGEYLNGSFEEEDRAVWLADAMESDRPL